jgi:hypothetical protein
MKVRQGREGCRKASLDPAAHEPMVCGTTVLFLDQQISMLGTYNVMDCLTFSFSALFENVKLILLTLLVILECLLWVKEVSDCFSGDEHITSVSEFNIHKVHGARHQDPQRRTLCLSETCLLERDPQTYSICTLRPLADIFALVRSLDNPQLFNIEYISGQVRTYTAADR